MSYKYITDGASYIGQSLSTSNDIFFIDGILSQKDNVSQSMNVKSECKGKKHIFSLFKTPQSALIVTKSLLDYLSKVNKSDMRIKTQYDLRDLSERLKEEAKEDDTSYLSSICIDKKNIYAFGFGKINIYSYSKKEKKAKKLEIGYVNSDDALNDNSLSDFLRARTKFLCEVKSGDSYIIVSDKIEETLSSDLIIELIESTKENISQTLINKCLEKGADLNDLCAICVRIKKERKLMFWGITVFVLLILISVLTFILKDKLPFFNKSVPTISNEIDTDTTLDEEVTSSIEEKKENELEDLAYLLDNASLEVRGENSKVSYYVKNLKTGDEIIKNNSKMYSASLIKLFVLGSLYNEINNGLITFTDEIKKKTEDMITKSDNDATNELCTIIGQGNQELGFEKITAFSKDIGCEFTQQKNDLQATRPYPIPVGNFTSVKDCGIVLEKIYNGEFINKEFSDMALDLLKRQQRREKIPKGVGEGVVVANKTGETSKAQNDVAIVFSPNCDYILCIMINDHKNTWDEACEIVSKLSKITYDYLNTTDDITKDNQLILS